MKIMTHMVPVTVLIVVLSFWPALAADEVIIPNDFQANTPAVADEVNDNFTALKDAVDPINSNYTESGGLNWSYTDVTDTWTELTTGSGAHTFTKEYDDSAIEVIVNSRFWAGTFAGGAARIFFRVRIDDTIDYDIGNDGAILTTGGDDFLSMFCVFEGLAAGTHEVSIYARTNTGSSTNVLADAYGVGGRIIVRETR